MAGRVLGEEFGSVGEQDQKTPSAENDPVASHQVDVLIPVEERRGTGPEIPPIGGPSMECFWLFSAKLKSGCLTCIAEFPARFNARLPQNLRVRQLQSLSLATGAATSAMPLHARSYLNLRGLGPAG